MALTFPTEINKNFHVSANNLKAILAIEKNDSLLIDKTTTQVAFSSFKAIENAQLGLGHYLKKHLASGAVYGSILALPAAGLLGSVYYAQEAAKTTDLSTLVYGGVAVGSLWTADMFLGKVIGIRPFTAALVLAYDIYREGARKLSKEVLQSYTHQEEAMNEIKKQQHEVIKAQLKGAYAGIAQELSSRFDKAQTEDASKLKELKQIIGQLEEKMPILDKAFSKLDLSPAERMEILDPLKNMIALISQSVVTVRAVETDKDNGYNAALIVKSNNDEFMKACLTPAAKEHFEEASKEVTTFAYRAKAKIYSTLSGLAALAAVPAAISGVVYAANEPFFTTSVGQLKNIVQTSSLSDAPGYLLPSVVGIGALTLLASAKAGHLTSEKYNQAIAKQEERRAAHVDAAVSELKGVYDGIATKVQSSNAAQKAIIASRLQILQGQLATYGYESTYFDITEKLRTKLGLVSTV
jgi:gas vesicle protein